MRKFVALVTLTQKGHDEIRDTIDRADGFVKLAAKVNCEVVQLLWTLGAYDGVIIFKAPDESTAAGLMLELASFGFVKPQTLRAFDREEIIRVLASAP